MKLDGGSGGAGDSTGGGENAVVVGIKLDSQSRELLTWALVNAARPGDRIIGLHVLDTVFESAASLLSLVKTFDSMLGVYRGFCNLKQVDLKIKVCRQTSARKVLVREAKLCGAASVIVGSSKKRHTIRSSASVAKYCARNLPKNISVFAVDHGKTVFRRAASITDDYLHINAAQLVRRSSNGNMETAKGTKELNSENRNSYSRLDFDRVKTDCTSSSEFPDSSNGQPLVELPENICVDNSLALVPMQTSGADSDLNSPSATSLPQSKSGWPFLRSIYPCKRQNSDRSATKMSLFRWVSRLRGRSSAAVAGPEKKQDHSDHDNELSSNFDGTEGATIPFGSEVASSSPSPCRGFNNLPKELEDLHERYSSTCRLFTYWELLSITSDFSGENMVGKGGSSYVYRGCLSDGKELAIKILKPSVDVLREFTLEIDIITSLHHKNIVSLFGFCFENGNLILVYDFLPRGSLEESLHGNKKDVGTFGWAERHKVAVGIAEALDYLHNGREPPVIHRDVKSSNILLSDDFEPQLSDFGFASLASNTSPVTCTDVAGTFGYMAPEYFMHGKTSDKIDVYAFGVVLLELLSGRKPISSGCPQGHESLVMWAKPILESGKFSQLMDPSLQSSDDNDLIGRIVLAAALCIRRAPSLRPQISLVLKLLQGDEGTTNWARQQIDVSEEAGSCDDESSFRTNIESHINLALLDLEDDSNSDISPDHSVSVEEYLKGRWSRASSFD